MIFLVLLKLIVENYQDQALNCLSSKYDRVSDIKEDFLQ
jgi:hypothetical protein